MAASGGAVKTPSTAGPAEPSNSSPPSVTVVLEPGGAQVDSDAHDRSEADADVRLSLSSPRAASHVAELVAAGPEAHGPLANVVVESILQRCVHWLHFDSCLPKAVA